MFSMVSGPGDYDIERAADIIKQAREIEQDSDLMKKVAAQLKKEQKMIDDAVDSLPDDLREMADEPQKLDPDDEDSRVASFIERIRKDREDEAMKTNETPEQRRKRLKRGSNSPFRKFT